MVSGKQGTKWHTGRATCRQLLMVRKIIAILPYHIFELLALFLNLCMASHNMLQISTSQRDLVHLHGGGQFAMTTTFCDPSSHITERGDRWEKNISCSIFWKMDSGVRYMHTRVGQILRSLFWTFLIHTANVSSFEHAVALKVPYYQPYVSMIWLLSYFELNCTAWPSNWQVLYLYSTKKCSFSKYFRPAVVSAHISRGACM